MDRGAPQQATASDGASEAVASVPLWYHTMELAPGVVTPGWFDLRPIVDRLPWPDVRGKRCLDVGPYDGFLSFELERRGASEVVAADIGSPAEWDWPAALRERGSDYIAQIAGTDTGAGFRVASRLLGSSVQRVEVSVYDLSPDRLGSFDVVVCGSLLLHLRDPVRGLEAIRSVCRGSLLSSETITVGLTAIGGRAPMAELRGGDRCQWWIPNAAGHRRLVTAAGFAISQRSRPYSIPLGPGHRSQRPGGPRRRRALTRLLTGGSGVSHSAVLARPAG